MSDGVVYKVIGLKRYFLAKKRGIMETITRRPTIYVKALDGVTMEISRGQTMGVVGESGSGKTTLGRILATLDFPTEGKLIFNGIEVNKKNVGEVRKKVHMVFQNPATSVNPRIRVKDIVMEGMRKRDHNRVKELLEAVGLDYSSVKDKYPRELSGGQLQRVAIARALAKEPEFLVLDEATSALDASVQAQILNLLADLQKERGISYLFITHNISVAGFISDKLAVMYAGKV
ncbi:MAG: oligopeptide/dipeptide ABC transporter ATPase, partial [Candidatus Aramenus sulfurataquae]